MIDFNLPPYVGNETKFIKDAVDQHLISGDGKYTKLCKKWIDKKTKSNSLLVTSGSTALDMAAILANIKSGDEVILPSYTFVSTANAFVMRGATPVFVDIRPDTMNIDETKIEAAITKKTKAVCVVHYAGVACEMDTIVDICKRHKLILIEDAAQGVMSEYKGRALGSIGDFGCFSFHETKNYSMGEGGALIVKNQKTYERAEIIREKGTNRSKFFRGQVDKYTWVDVGSSYLASDINAAYLYAQLLKADEINNNRLRSWNLYYKNLLPLKEAGKIELPVIPDDCKHNSHMFYVKTKNLKERTALQQYLKKRGVQACFHYIPLHSSPMGKKVGRFSGKDEYTTRESNRLLRLPMYYKIGDKAVIDVCKKVKDFYK